MCFRVYRTLGIKSGRILGYLKCDDIIGHQAKQTIESLFDLTGSVGKGIPVLKIVTKSEKQIIKLKERKFTTFKM